MGNDRRQPAGPSGPGLVGAVALLAGVALFGVWAVGRLIPAPPLAGGQIPAVAYEAYLAAAGASPTVAPDCLVDWSVLAGIAQVESEHGRVNGVSLLAANGDIEPPIRGAALDGSSGTQEVRDTDGGALDGDTTWDRAMGPLQFIPATWRDLGLDGNGDGVADPDNLFDAALTAVAHLCIREPGDYSDRGQLRDALIAYNASGRYADRVLRWIDHYRTEPVEELLESLEPESSG